MIVRLSRRMRRSGDDGMAMIFVIISMMVISLFVTAGLAYAVAGQRSGRFDQDHNAALAAAQAGVDDYIAHLNRNDNYGRQNPFTDCSNAAIAGPKAPVPNTCGWSSTTPVGWQSVNSGPTIGTPQFHYDVDASQLIAAGTIYVRSTGRVNAVRRTIEVAVSRSGSTQFLYYTDHENADPANRVLYPYGMPANCGAYWWGPSKDYPNQPARATNDYGCIEITFIGGDVLDGAVHTNDTPLYTSVNGTLPQFKSSVQTADPACQSAVANQPSTWPYCDRYNTGANYAVAPAYHDTLYLPDNSGAFASYPGCQYTGPTRIIFNSDGTMNVWSKQSTTTAACGGTAPWNARVPVPADQVIYVKSGTSTHVCRQGEIDGTLPLGTFNGTNQQNSYTQDLGMQPASQYCGEGNAYVQGTLKGRVTIATQNSIVATGDLRLAGGMNGNDMLGLVAANSVEVFHPVLQGYACKRMYNGVCTGGYGPSGGTSEVGGWPVRSNGSTSGIEIDASIQTLAHSFLVQNYNYGSPQGKLTVRGSIAQKWRGIVGQGNPPNTGYLKDYHYDLRLKYASPPYFPQFINSVWGARHTGEIAPQY